MSEARPALVWIVSGAQGAGRGGVSERLAARYPRALHVRTNDLHRVFGRSPSLEPTSVEMEAGRRTAARLAAEHVALGTTVVIDDSITESELDPMRPFLDGLTVHKVLLSPSVFAIHRRVAPVEAERLETAKVVHSKLVLGCRPEAGWLVLDTFARSMSDTVDAMLRHFESG